MVEFELAKDKIMMGAERRSMPQWNLKTARKCAREVERIIQSEELPWLLKNMYSNQPDSWDDSLQGWDRYRYTVNL